MRSRRRRQERGAALLIVVLVVLALTSAGLFAARAASSDTEISGRYRQLTVTKAVAQLGMQASMTEFGRDPSAYIRAMSGTNVGGPTLDIANLGGGSTPCKNGPVASGGCYRFAYAGVENSIGLQANNTSLQLMDPGDLTTAVPSAIGMGEVRPDFDVEVTDKVELDWLTPGEQVGAGTPMKYYAVTMTSTGLIVPRSGALAVGDWGKLVQDPTKDYLASTQEVRAQVIVGPLPGGL